MCSQLSLTQAYRERSDPGLLLDGEMICSHSWLEDDCHSTDHILAIQWASEDDIGSTLFYLHGLELNVKNRAKEYTNDQLEGKGLL